MKHPPTPQQAAYFNLGTDPRSGSVALDAKAGTGKTTTQAGLAAKLPGSGLATSVLKSTVADLGKAMPGNWESRGLHSLGYAAIRKKHPRIKVDSGGNALYEFCKERLSDESEWWKTFAEVKPLVEQALLAGIVPNHERFITPDESHEWEALADRFDIEWEPVVYETAHAALVHLNNLATSGTSLTFAHMLTLPLFWSGYSVQQYPKVIVDEAQDLNPLQHRMIAKALRHNGRVFVTGDPNQAIMAFSGADSNSFHNLVQQFSCTVLPLTWCFRCGTEIIAEAQRDVPSLEAPPGAHQGAVVQADHIDLDDLPRTIICRNNAPNLRLAMRLFTAGYTVECAGKDIGAGLKSTIKRIASGKNAASMPAPEFLSRLQAWADREIKRRPARKHTVQDKRDALAALAEHHQTLGAITQHIDQLYQPEPDGKRLPAEFQLLTIHKSKGREYDKVGFLDAHLIPAKWAKQDWELEQERNLRYVGVTRAKNELVYLDSDLIQ
jgi:superfamily I DNA/RNA helicase